MRKGCACCLLVDSLTRFVRAAREVGLAAGEPPARRGFPPSAFAELAPLIERTGLTDSGSITAFYTVLVEGNDLDEPVADEVRGLLDGHLVLDRALGASAVTFRRSMSPRSLSRLMDELVSAAPSREPRSACAAGYAHYAEKRDLVELGAVQPGHDPLLDRGAAPLPAIERFLRQERAEAADFSTIQQALVRSRASASVIEQALIKRESTTPRFDAEVSPRFLEQDELADAWWSETPDRRSARAG